MKHPGVVRGHSVKGDIQTVDAIFLRKLQQVALFFKVPGGIAADAEQRFFRNVRLVRQMIVPVGVGKEFHRRGDHFIIDDQTVLIVSQDLSVFIIQIRLRNWFVRDDIEQRKMGAELFIPMCRTGRIFYGFPMLMISVFSRLEILSRNGNSNHQHDGNQANEPILHLFPLCQAISSLCTTRLT